MLRSNSTASSSNSGGANASTALRPGAAEGALREQLFISDGLQQAVAGVVSFEKLRMQGSIGSRHRLAIVCGSFAPVFLEVEVGPCLPAWALDSRSVCARCLKGE